MQENQIKIWAYLSLILGILGLGAVFVPQLYILLESYFSLEALINNFLLSGGIFILIYFILGAVVSILIITGLMALMAIILNLFIKTEFIRKIKDKLVGIFLSVLNISGNLSAYLRKILYDYVIPAVRIIIVAFLPAIILFILRYMIYPESAKPTDLILTFLTCFFLIEGIININLEYKEKLIKWIKFRGE